MKISAQQIKWIVLFLATILFSTNELFAIPTNFTWNGSESRDWRESKNWDPEGIPGTNDTVLVVSGSNFIELSGDVTVRMFTIESETIDLNGYTLTITGQADFIAGEINNGHLTDSGTSAIHFSGTTFGAVVNVTGGSIFLDGSVFNDSLVITKNGKSNDNSKGGNTFAEYVSITNSDEGALVLADSFPDTFDRTVDFTNFDQKGAIYIAHRSSGNIFNGDVKFAGQRIYSNYYGTAEYNGNISIACQNGEVYFGLTEGSCTLADEKIIALSDVEFSSGKLFFRNFTKLGTGAIDLTLVGSAKVYFDASVFNSEVTISAPAIYLSTSRFLSNTTFTKTGSGTEPSLGGCYFGGTTSITNNHSSSVFTLNSAYTDTFAGGTTIQNTLGTLQINNAVFSNAVLLKNSVTSTALDRFFVAATGSCVFDGALTVENTGSGFNFGNVNGTTSLSSTGSLTFSSGLTGNVNMSNFTKLGSGNISLSFPSTTTKLILGPNSTLNGDFNFYGQSICLNGTTFNNAVAITRYGNIPDTCKGGNVFNGTTTIKDSIAGTYNLLMAYTTADDYNGNVTFIQKGSGGKIYPSYTKNSTFSGNITVDASSSFQFGGNGGKVILDGSANQSLTSLTSQTITMKKLQINKSANSFTLTSPLSIADSLQLTLGRINTDTTNLLAIAHGGKLTGGSDSSYINGPLKKTGNSAFVFPIGSSTLAHPYHPLEITAPTSSTDAYTANYFPIGQYLGSVSDTSVDNLNECQYWKLTRNAGVSKVKLKLNWNNDTCLLLSPQNVRIVSWNNVLWKDFGNSSYAGDSLKGFAMSSDSIASTAYLTIALKKCLLFHSTLSSKSVSCEGRSDGFCEVSNYRGTAPYSYAWEPVMGDKKYNAGLSPGKYYITSMDSKTCQLRDSITLELPEPMVANFTIDSSECALSNGSISASLTGGLSPYNYFWPGLGIKDSIASNIKSGKYSLVVTDSIGCTSSFTATLSDSNGPKGSITELLGISCYGQTSGSLKFDLLSSDTNIVKYEWDRNVSDTDSIISEIGAGMKSLLVMDANGCSSFFDYLLTEPKEIKINFNVTNSHCSEFDGSIVSLVTGGERPYVYSWSSMGSDSVESDLRSGYDTLTVIDYNNCRAISIAEILDDDGPILTPHIISAANCFNDPNGSVVIAVTSAAAPYNFTYFPYGENKDTISGLSVGEYFVVVEDSNGCIQKKSFVIPGYDPLDISLYTENASNDSVADGKAFAFVLGGKTPYTYLWSDNSILDSVNNLTIGDHSLIVTDQNGCSDTSNFRIGTTMHPVDLQFQCDNSPIPISCPPVTFTCGSPCTLDIVMDFGADPTGTSSSECAFESAAAFLQGLDPDIEKTLFIPFGTYIVGRQDNRPDYYLKGNNVMCFDGINNLTIEGEIFYDDTSTLIFENCMKMGSFDYPNNPDDRLLMCVDAAYCAYNGTNYSHLATMGQMIHLNECNNVTIKNLKLDGNLDNAIVGGAWPNGMPYDGIFLNACHNFTIENVITQNFGHDGIWINHRQKHFDPSQPIAIPNFGNVNGYINHVKSTNNCRTGLVWGGGSGLRVFNSEFSWNGMHRYSLQMRAGLDIEFEISNFANTNGYFYNCRFEYNADYGMVNDAQIHRNEFNHARNSYFNRDHVFEICTFISAARPNSKAIHPNTKGMHFIDCNLYGWCANAYQNARFYLDNTGQLITFPDQSTSFTFCDFFEEYLNPIDNITRSFGWDVDETGGGCPVPWHHPLIEFSTALGVRFISSTITSNYTMKWILLSTDGQPIIVPRDLWNVIGIEPFSGTSSIWRNFGLNACDPISCERNLGSINHTRLDNPLQIIGITGLNNASLACGGQDHYYLETLDLSIDDRNNRLWGDNITGNPSQVFPGLNVSPSVPKFEYIDPSPISVFSDCSNCTGPNDDCFACSTTEPSPSCPIIPALRRGNKDNLTVSDLNKMVISPNPVSSIVKIETEILIHEIKIFDIFGSLVFSVIVNGSTYDLQVSFLKPGTYFIDADNSLHKMFVKL